MHKHFVDEYIAEHFGQFIQVSGKTQEKIKHICMSKGCKPKVVVQWSVTKYYNELKRKKLID